MKRIMVGGLGVAALVVSLSLAGCGSANIEPGVPQGDLKSTVDMSPESPHNPMSTMLPLLKKGFNKGKAAHTTTKTPSP